jgi:serine/threonine protein kinase
MKWLPCWHTPTQRTGEAFENVHVRSPLLHCLPQVGAYVKVADFGLSHILAPDETHASVRSGTPGYTAPEVMAHGRATMASDIYAIGKQHNCCTAMVCLVDILACSTVCPCTCRLLASTSLCMTESSCSIPVLPSWDPASMQAPACAFCIM